MAAFAKFSEHNITVVSSEGLKSQDARQHLLNIKKAHSRVIWLDAYEEEVRMIMCEAYRYVSLKHYRKGSLLTSFRPSELCLCKMKRTDTRSIPPSLFFGVIPTYSFLLNFAGRKCMLQNTSG